MKLVIVAEGWIVHGLYMDWANGHSTPNVNWWDGVGGWCVGSCWHGSC